MRFSVMPPSSDPLMDRFCCYHIATGEGNGRIIRISMETTAARTNCPFHELSLLG
jgi:hypothetical protein